MTTLGYGDMSPKSYVGKVVALMSACAGLCNLTFLINLIGECFEEVFRKYVLDRNQRMVNEWPLYVDKHVTKVVKNLKMKRSVRCSCKGVLNECAGKDIYK